MKCPACTSEIAVEGESCPSCGASLDESYAETRILPVDSKPRSGRNSGRRTPPHTRTNSVHTTSDALDNSRFVSGTILNDRYRIVGLLGRGGMGEVYRAEDLTLGQPVALKFLPEALSADNAALSRFLREVRVARQISHRNVCRVYDIDESEGQQFLSMEFVRGEELSSVLKRFGRLPSDKATEIARQLCAGLAAAHDAGVLHRDLKPSNVMIDEKGDVRVTDFGLAGLLEEFGDGAALEGTPEYMSPEQLAGRELNERSDIYSLGLVLYELYTGHKAFTAPTLSELLRLRKTESMPERPSAIVRDLDPLVERVVERCLAPDPQQRPANALQVANALPGGDPLAAALAAGETPSPEMVAAAPKQGSLRPAVALALAGGALALFALCFALSGRIYLHRRVPLEKSAEALRDRASEIAHRFGYESAADSSSGFYVNAEYMTHVQQNDSSASRWERLRTGHPAGIIFWYRQSPRYLTALSPEGVTLLDPPRTVSGMANVTLDTRGRMLAFEGVPQQTVQPEEPAPAPSDWSRLFREAGLDPATFKKVEPVWVSPHAFDEHAAWEGTYPGQPDTPLRVEAAAFRGRPVYFQLVNPWNQARRQEELSVPATARMFLAAMVVIFCAMMAGAALLARHNLRLGRGDRRGALRLAAIVFAGTLFDWLLTAHHVPSLLDEFEAFLLNLAWCLLDGAIMWLIYIALEPYVRRRWPGRIVGWSRLLAGGWRDPLVGRDLLIGALAGCAIILLLFVRAIAAPWLGVAPPRPDAIYMRVLLGMQYAFGSLTAQVLRSLLFASVLMFLLLLLTIVTRREWVGVALLWVLVSGFFFGSGNVGLDIAFGGVAAAVTLFVLLRFGMLALVSTEFFLIFFSAYPVTTDFNAWYAGMAAFGAALCVALILYGLKTSLAGQPLLRHSLLGD